MAAQAILLDELMMLPEAERDVLETMLATRARDRTANRMGLDRAVVARVARDGLRRLHTATVNEQER